MLFWNIAELKRRLTDEGLSESSAFRYFLATAALHAMAVNGATLACFHERGDWSRVGSVVLVAAEIWGLFYVYRMNGGPRGRHFLARAVSIGWVLSIRFAGVMALVGGLPFLWAVSKGWVSAGSPSGPVNAYLLVGTLALKVLFYSRFGTHVLAVATARPV